MLAGTDERSFPAGESAGWLPEARSAGIPALTDAVATRMREVRQILERSRSGDGVGLLSFALQERFEFGLLKAGNQLAIDQKRRCP